jgi:hypothetical protein
MTAYSTPNHERFASCNGAMAAALIVVLSCGCATNSKSDKLASWNPAKTLGWTKDEEEKPAPQVPTRLVATWTETVLNKAGESPKRGFGGRIAFFTRESDDSVRVDGQLVVYAFDETAREPHETQPTRKYIFPAGEFVRHESESALGPTYSFWLPWDEVGGPQRHISLIARFEPTGGPIVIGEQTKHFLPGAAVDASDAQLADGASDVVNSVRMATYSQPGLAPEPDLAQPLSALAEQARQPKERPQMSTETIPLPPRLGAALAQPQQTADASSTYDARATADLPLSQIATMGRGEAAETAAAEVPAQANAVEPGPVRTPLRAIAEERRSGSRSSQGSPRDSHPAQARQFGPTVHGRVR